MVGRRSFEPISSSVSWLQRGCGTFGLTLAQNPYSDGANASQKLFGRWSVKVKRTIDLIDLNPYFHGIAIRSGAPCTFGIGLPYAPTATKASSFVASAMVRPST